MLFLGFISSVFVCISSVGNALDTSCLDSSKLVLTSHDNQIYINGVSFIIKGYISSKINSIQELVNSDVFGILNALRDTKSNAWGLVIKEWEATESTGIETKDASSIFYGKTALDALDIIVDEAAARGIFVILDIESEQISAYEILAKRFKNKWNILGVTVYEHPKDIDLFPGGLSEAATKAVAIGNRLIDLSVNWLFFDSGRICTWYSNRVLCRPEIELELSVSDRIVNMPYLYNVKPKDDGKWTRGWGKKGVNAIKVATGYDGFEWNLADYGYLKNMEYKNIVFEMDKEVLNVKEELAIMEDLVPNPSGITCDKNGGIKIGIDLDDMEILKVVAIEKVGNGGFAKKVKHTIDDVLDYRITLYIGQLIGIIVCSVFITVFIVICLYQIRLYRKKRKMYIYKHINGISISATDSNVFE